MGSTRVAWLIAFGGTGLGLTFGIWEQQLREAILEFCEAVATLETRPIHFGAVVFLLVCLIWAVALALRLMFEKEEVVKRTFEQMEHTTEAILHAPNIVVIEAYPKTYYPQIVKALGSLPSKPGEIPADELAKRIRSALLTIATMARDYAKRPTSVVYGANLMLIAAPERFQAFDGDVSFVLSQHEVKSLKALLYLPQSLLVTTTLEDSARIVPLIVLPVPFVDKTDRGYDVALPGAPRSLSGDGPAIVPDTRAIREQCQGMHADIVRQIEDYFAPGGEGSGVRSFASFRLTSDPNDPVGILNIDSAETNVLGPRLQFAVTFQALLHPILVMLAPFVATYSREAGKTLFQPPARSPKLRTAIKEPRL